MSLIMLFIFFFLSTIAGAKFSGGNETWRQKSDRVQNLPGQPPVNFSHYAGYIKLRSEQEKALFYWFFEAQHAPSEKPLVLWLNGGMNACSIKSF